MNFRRAIFYIGSFSKILSPSTRVGWIIVPEGVIEKLEILKEASDINTATFSQHIISSYIEMGVLGAHLSLLKKHYKEKRDVMANALKQYTACSQEEEDENNYTSANIFQKFQQITKSIVYF